MKKNSINKVQDINNVKFVKLVENIANIHKLVNQFVKKILFEICNNIDDIYIQSGVDDDMKIYTICIFNKKTNCAVQLTYPLKEFLELVNSKKIEFELNKKIRKMVLMSEEKDETDISKFSLKFLY